MPQYFTEKGVKIKVIGYGSKPFINVGGKTINYDGYDPKTFSVYNWILKAEEIANERNRLEDINCYIPDIIHDVIYDQREYLLILAATFTKVDRKTWDSNNVPEMRVKIPFMKEIS